jgi:hypothetical protein
MSLPDTRNDNGGDIRATVRMKWSIVVTLLSLAGAVGAQAILFGRWLIEMHADVIYLKLQNQEQNKIILRMDDVGTKRVAPMEARLNELALHVQRLDVEGGRKVGMSEERINNLVTRLNQLQDQVTILFTERRNLPFLMQQPPWQQPGAAPQCYKLQSDVLRPYTLDPP